MPLSFITLVGTQFVSTQLLPDFEKQIKLKNEFNVNLM
jgi:hypothetical protein